MKLKHSVALVASAVALTACGPKPEPVDNRLWLEQGWTDEARQKYHYISQGTATIPIPWEWFMNLEQPGIWNGLKGKLISDPDYLPDELGFIPGNPDPEINPSQLPVGFSIMKDFPNPILGRNATALGFTCAACHTGQMEFQGQKIYYDGGPAMTDLSGLTNKLVETLLETRFIPTRFDRFARRVLQDDYNPQTRKALKKEFSKVLTTLLKETLQGMLAAAENETALNNALANENESAPILKKLRKALRDGKSMEEGFTRLDALNRIGNAVFAADLHNPTNTRKTNAPVNYPHIWNTSWFDWVQYDGSVMQPMVRNAGEALGVYAAVNLKPGKDQFASSVPLDTLHWVETLLAGEQNPYQQKQFGGLQSPQWPEHLLPPINKPLAAKGAALYAENCEGCHLPPIDSDKFWTKKVWAAQGTANNPLIAVNIIPLDTIGTDSAQADVLVNRRVSIEGMELKTQVYLADPSSREEGQYRITKNGDYDNGCKPVMVDSSKESNPLFALALGAVVQEVNDFWYGAHNISPEQQEVMNGQRLNCLQAGAGYKARPLNGIWATAPFLHNGAVANLYELLSPVEERQVNPFLGSREFDPVRVGYRSDKGPFQLNTSLHGNTNVGHEFTDARQGKGVIGRGLREDERWALVEYLKTL